MIEEIKFKDETLAMIIKNNFVKEGISFFTPDDFSQQLAYMKHPKGKEIIPHVHNPVKREVYYTNEVLFIKKGKLRVDFYSDEKIYIESRVLNKGDVILLVSGGHGFSILEDIEMIEVKQGPYAGDSDKTRFTAIDESELIIK
jgi:mannose-6-phosphate isomerase-like protein (cupin superfamily)|tara:strand:+ start:161 stop:589 length:429 start_codon:yes stop_codon:yes gene_type:complete